MRACLSLSLFARVCVYVKLFTTPAICPVCAAPRRPFRPFGEVINCTMSVVDFKKFREPSASFMAAS